jgi:hypothetical protein
MDRYVFSKTKKEFDGNPIAVNSDFLELIQKLKQELWEKYLAVRRPRVDLDLYGFWT